MRASEALMLGSTMLKPKRHRFDADGEGCALGMINRAVGGDRHTEKFREAFPWMRRHSAAYPCDCWFGPDGVTSVVIHLFDYHKEWTVERIADWLAKVDPTASEEKPVEVAEEVGVAQ